MDITWIWDHWYYGYGMVQIPIEIPGTRSETLDSSKIYDGFVQSFVLFFLAAHII